VSEKSLSICSAEGRDFTSEELARLHQAKVKVEIMCDLKDLAMLRTGLEGLKKH
jgi:hypothetical protein